MRPSSNVPRTRLTDPAQRTGPALRQYLSRLLYAAVLTGVGLYVWRNLEGVLDPALAPDWGVLASAFGLLCVASLGLCAIWSGLGAQFGLNAPFSQAARAWLLGQLGKYVPGKITVLLVRFDVYSGFPKQKVVLATLVEYVAMLAGASILMLISLVAAPSGVPDAVRWVAALGAVAALACLWPPVFVGLANVALRLAGREQRIDEFPDYPTTLRYVAWYGLGEFLHGLAFFLVLRSVYPVDWQHLLLIVGLYEGASLVGLAALFSPSGIGVREGVLMLVLPLLTPSSAAIAAAILMRLVVTLNELVMAGLAVAWARHSRPPAARRP